ncbi:MAG: hypothetical protein PHD38_07280, partial [Mesotoga sp.]|nr:hypothetical protein [Mesotoga sp.]
HRKRSPPLKRGFKIKSQEEPGLGLSGVGSGSGITSALVILLLFRRTVDGQRGFHQCAAILRIVEILKQVQNDGISDKNLDARRRNEEPILLGGRRTVDR